MPPAARAGDLPDPSTCDREPIHIPGAIPRHGVLLAADPQPWIVEQASANVAARLGYRSPVAFIARFKRVLARAPGRYVRG